MRKFDKIKQKRGFGMIQNEQESKIKANFSYLMIVVPAALFSYGYHITHVSIGVDDTALKLFYEEGLSVCTNRWTLFFLNRVLRFHIVNWPAWLVESLAICILTASLSLWCFLIGRVIASVKVMLPKWYYGLAAAFAVSCPILSEIWVYYFHNGVAIGYGFAALSLLLFMQSLQLDGRHAWNIAWSGLCLAIALGCYETMMDCFLVGALAIFMILHAFSNQKEHAAYDTRFLSWTVRGVLY